ncbi:hypothetical protein [Halorhabdus sp. CUG00001]|uniref:DUF7545 family protein n=1 Tax=Halorhabdus sp. CUG00001 TaxID=2600297 RepID=UPI00131B2A0F|nr:hypothetical protein [Halorhabdus sp. CUG00001]
MAAKDLETTTVTVSTDDASDDMEVPLALIELLTEGEEDIPTVVADIAMFGLAQRVHTAVHHSQGDPSADIDADIEDIEAATDERFEERFGSSFEELLDHSH